MKPEDNIRENSERNDDNFIMLPTVDFCFKGLMNNPKVRKGFIAALVTRKPGRNILILWRCRFWNSKSCLRISGAEMTLLNG